MMYAIVLNENMTRLGEFWLEAVVKNYARHSASIVAAMLAATVAVATHASESKQAGPGTIGLAITTFRLAHYSGANDCPDGLTPLMPAQFLASLPLDEQARLSVAERDPELVFRATTLPSGMDTSSTPYEALALRENYPDTLVVQGDRSFGLDLDGSSNGDPTPTGIRPHVNFTGVNGEPGVDNELYRALGCSRHWRWDARANESVTDPFDDNDLSGFGADNVRDGQSTMLIEITGVDDLMNDPDVEVGFYVGLNPISLDATNKLQAYTSQTVDPNPLWHNQLRGRIVNSILETEPADIRLRRTLVSIDAETFILGSRLRLELRPDGSARGILAGYEPIGKMYWPGPSLYRANLAIGVKNPDPTYYRALYQYADAYPDAETGQYTAISMARAINAVPAFIFHEPSREPVITNVGPRSKTQVSN